MIRVEDLSKIYPGTVALDRLTFHVPRGQILGFLGPNGAGKTTTMKILTGYIAPSAGRAEVAGHDVVEESLAVRRRVGYLPENAPLYGEMRVGDYLRFVAGVRDVPAKRRRAAVDAALDACGLGDVRQRTIGHLSKGYRQRVGLAQAMVHDPDLLVLDEPTAGLDPNQLGDVRALIRRLGREKTVVFSSHILQEVEAVATRVVIINKGRLVADDAPAALQARLSGRTRLHVTLAGGAVEDVRARLAAVAGVTAVAAASAAEGVAAVVEAAPNADVRPEVFRAAVAAGWVLLEMRREAADLEAVFHTVTRGAA
jgi:ABC-2 type transport system ATP-binding protein